jgi:hypothetical protein
MASHPTAQVLHELRKRKDLIKGRYFQAFCSSAHLTPVLIDLALGYFVMDGRLGPEPKNTDIVVLGRCNTVGRRSQFGQALGIETTFEVAVLHLWFAEIRLRASSTESAMDAFDKLECMLVQGLQVGRAGHTFSRIPEALWKSGKDQR